MKYMTEIETSQLIGELAPELKKIEQVTPPSWATFVKTGGSKQKPPVQEDWWYIRAASLLVKVQSRGPVGVSKLRTLYGGKKRRGHKPAEFRKASGNILRKLLQQLESAGLLKQTEKGIYKGRILTPKGRSLINTVAKASKKRVPKKAAVSEKKPEQAKPDKQPQKEMPETQKSKAGEKAVKAEAKPSGEAPAEKPKPKAKQAAKKDNAPGKEASGQKGDKPEK